jgi:hypothetical protein
VVIVAVVGLEGVGRATPVVLAPVNINGTARKSRFTSRTSRAVHQSARGVASHKTRQNRRSHLHDSGY